MTHLRIGYSTCPNDTYIFAGLPGSEDDSPFTFDPVLADVETLNGWALEKRLDITKLSFFAFGKVREQYALLHAGGALGRGCGPVIVSRPGTDLRELENGIIAAPGNLTTARLLLTLYLKKEPQFKQMVFSEIMPAVCEGKADFGLVIHEGRFTYQDHNLQILLDLGEWWEQETGYPIPLGGIAIRRDLGENMAREVDRCIRTSLNIARNGSEHVTNYVMFHAQEMIPRVVQQHIDLYVNRFSEDLGEEGREAILFLMDQAERAGRVKPCSLPLMAY